MTHTDFLISKVPEEEREELARLIAERLSALSPSDKGFAIAEHRLNIQKKIREHGGLITEEQADEKMHEELVANVDKLQRFAVHVGNTQLYRDLERYPDVPEIALLKNYSLDIMVQVVKERQQEKEKEQH